MARGRSRNKRTNTKRSSAMSRYQQQAGTETALRYGPQLSALQDLMMQTRQTKSDAVHRARDSALAMQSFYASQQPQVEQIFRNSEQALARPVPMPSGVGPGSSALQQAFTGSQAASQGQLAASKASALSGIVSRQGQAFERGRNDEAAARSSYEGDVGKIGRQRSQLANEAGLFESDALNKLLQAAGQRSLTRRGQTLTRQNALDRIKDTQAGRVTANRDRDADRAIRQQNSDTSAYKARHPAKSKGGGSGGGSKGGKGKDWLNRNQTNNAVKNVTEAQAWIRKLSGLKGWNSTKVRQALTTGHTIKGKDKTGVLQTINVPKFDKDLAVNPAFDLHTLNGKLSPANTRALHDAGIHIPRNWRFKGAPRRPSSQRYGGK